MTIVIDNASFSFVKAIKELAKIDGATVRTEKKSKIDPFYSEENMAVLKKSMAQFEQNKVVIHKPIEV